MIRKIILIACVALFTQFMSAQELVSLETIQKNPNEITKFASIDAQIFKKLYGVEDQMLREVENLMYSKYKQLTSENISKQEVEKLSEGIYQRFNSFIPQEILVKLKEDQKTYEYITGKAYVNLVKN